MTTMIRRGQEKQRAKQKNRILLGTNNRDQTHITGVPGTGGARGMGRQGHTQRTLSAGPAGVVAKRCCEGVYPFTVLPSKLGFFLGTNHNNDLSATLIFWLWAFHRLVILQPKPELLWRTSNHKLSSDFCTL